MSRGTRIGRNLYNGRFVGSGIELPEEAQSSDDAEYCGDENYSAVKDKVKEYKHDLECLESAKYIYVKNADGNIIDTILDQAVVAKIERLKKKYEVIKCG